LAMLLLQSLPTTGSWETFKSSVLNSLPPQTHLSFLTLESRIVTEVLHIKGPNSDAMQAESALKASKNKRRPKSQKQKNCELHGAGGHSTKECFTLKWKKERDAEKKRQGKEKAHRAEEASESESSGSTDEESNSEDAHVSKALMARIQACIVTKPKAKTNDILIDSSASCPM
ncbi:hypothetical protein K439DRAFT_1277181, partial [Ramaria rubella]